MRNKEYFIELDGWLKSDIMGSMPGQTMKGYIKILLTKGFLRDNIIIVFNTDSDEYKKKSFEKCTYDCQIVVIGHGGNLNKRITSDISIINTKDNKTITNFPLTVTIFANYISYIKKETYIVPFINLNIYNGHISFREELLNELAKIKINVVVLARQDKVIRLEGTSRNINLLGNHYTSMNTFLSHLEKDFSKQIVYKYNDDLHIDYVILNQLIKSQQPSVTLVKNRK